MDRGGLVILSEYFKILKKKPTITQIKVIDTYGPTIAGIRHSLQNRRH